MFSPHTLPFPGLRKQKTRKDWLREPSPEVTQHPRGTDKWLLETGRITPEQAASAYAGTKAAGRRARRRDFVKYGPELYRPWFKQMRRPTPIERIEVLPGTSRAPTKRMVMTRTFGPPLLPETSPYELGVERYGAQPGITPLERATETADIALQEMRPPQARERFGFERAGAEMDIAGKREIMRGAEQERTQAAELHPSAVRTAEAGAGVAELGAKAGEAEFKRTQAPSFQAEQVQEKKRKEILAGLDKFEPGSLEHYRLQQEFMTTFGFKPGDTSPTADMMQRGIAGRQRQQAAAGIAANAASSSGLGQYVTDPDSDVSGLISPVLTSLANPDLDIKSDITEQLLEEALSKINKALMLAESPEAQANLTNEIRNQDGYQRILGLLDADQPGSDEQKDLPSFWWPGFAGKNIQRRIYYQQRYKKIAGLARDIVSQVQNR